MRELKQDWRDIFGSFRVAFDVWKLLLGLFGVVITCLVLWGLMSIPTDEAARPAGWIIAIIVSGLLLGGLVIKFALSDTGFTLSKFVMLLVMLAVLAGVVLLCALTDSASVCGRYGGMVFAVLVIWAFFGGAITRIAAVEITTDDRIGLGEAVGFAWKKYGAYLGATLLPAVAVIVLALSCALFGLVFRIPIVNWIVTVIFFILVLLSGFLMFLIGLGGMAGAPLMYPAVSAEGNDSFDAISRAYSYVFGRPWRYIFYNVAALLYGLACTIFVAFFVNFMLVWSLASVNYGTGGAFDERILPRLKSLMAPLSGPVTDVVERLGGWIEDWDVTSYVSGAFQRAYDSFGFERLEPGAVELQWSEPTAAVLIAIFLYILVGLVIAYVISLFFSMQTTIYLLLRKAVDGAEMTEVYREEEEEEYLSVTPEPEPEGEAPAEEEKEETPPKKKKAPRKKTAKKKEGEEKSD